MRLLVNGASLRIGRMGPDSLLVDADQPHAPVLATVARLTIWDQHVVAPLPRDAAFAVQRPSIHHDATADARAHDHAENDGVSLGRT